MCLPYFVDERGLSRFNDIVELTQFQYLVSDQAPTPDEIRKADKAKPFSYEMDLAFFVVHFGFSKADYDALTETEKLFIKKEYESDLVAKTTHMRNAVLNAVGNALRKKSARFVELWKEPRHVADKEYNENARAIVEEMEQDDGKSWVDRIYAANGQMRPSRSRLIEEGRNTNG